MDSTNGTVARLISGSWLRLALLAAIPALSGPARADVNVLLADRDDVFTQAIQEFDEAQQILSSDPDRARRLFRSAADRFESLAASGVANGQLEYNIGNCYLQAGDIGRAILHYRRAQRLIPNDPLLQENLKEARSRRLTPVDSPTRSALLHGLLFIHFDTSVQVRSIAAIILFTSIWVLLTVRLVIPRRGWTITAIVCAFLCATLGASLAFSHWSDRNAPGGVITAMDAAAYKGPGTGYQRQFEQPLQPGVEFTLRGRRGDWWSIELPDGKTGWIRAEQAELVPNPST